MGGSCKDRKFPSFYFTETLIGRGAFSASVAGWQFAAPYQRNLGRGIDWSGSGCGCFDYFGLFSGQIENSGTHISSLYCCQPIGAGGGDCTFAGDLVWSGIVFEGLDQRFDCLLPGLVNTVVGLRSVSDDLRDLMRSLQATPWQTFYC